jgi:hypothetical protein
VRTQLPEHVDREGVDRGAVEADARDPVHEVKPDFRRGLPATPFDTVANHSSILSTPMLNVKCVPKQNLGNPAERSVQTDARETKRKSGGKESRQK